MQSSSSFRRSGGRDERRRRLLADELSNSGNWPAYRVGLGDGPPQKSEHYGDALFLEEQPGLLDLIPRRMVFLVLLLAISIAILVGLIAAYAWMLDHMAGGGSAIAALDLAAKGSLGCWFSSLLLLAAGIAAMLIHSVRRHRIDDYQGRYRIWVWAAACWLLMATDQAASLREGFRDLMIALTDTPLVDNGDLWWAMLYALGLGVVGSRLLVDMRSNLLAVWVFVGAALVHSLAMAVRLGWMLPPIGNHQLMFLSGAGMTGNLMLMTAMVLHARHVIFDAEGLLPHCEPEIDDLCDADEATDSAYTVGGGWRKDSSHSTPQPEYRRAAMFQPVVATAPPPTPTAVASPARRKLTKSERKALKERLLRERLERERRSG